MTGLGGPEGARTPDPLVANRKTYFTKSCQNRRQTRGISKFGKIVAKRACSVSHNLGCNLAHFSQICITFLSRQLGCLSLSRGRTIVLRHRPVERCPLLAPIFLQYLTVGGGRLLQPL